MSIGAGKRRVEIDFQIRRGKIKNCRQNYTIPHAGNIGANFRIRTHNSPLRRESPRACSRYQPEGKRPSDCYKGGTHYMHRDKLVSRRNGNSKKQEFRASREKKGIPRRGRRYQSSSRDGSVEQTPFRGRKTPG